MFVRDCWRPHSDADIYSFIEEHPWTLLVNNGAIGPFVTNLPLLLDRSGGSKGVLVGQIARANAHADAIQRLDAPHAGCISRSLYLRDFQLASEARHAAYVLLQRRPLLWEAASSR